MLVKKRLLAILLVMAMILPASFVSAASPQAVADDNDYYMSVLSGLALLADGFAGKTSEDGAVTRLDFAHMAAYLMCGEEPQGNYTDLPIFNDVNRYTSGYSSLQYLKERRIITGDGGSFMPDEPISPVDAYVIVLRMLNFEHIAQAKGGYPTGYLNVANRLSINSISGETIDFPSVYKLFGDILLTSMLEAKSFSADGEITYDDRNSFLYYYHQISYVDGVLTENQRTSLLAEKNSQDSRIMIGDTPLKCGDESVNNYLGIDVRAFVKESGGEYDTIYVTPLPERSKVFELNSQDDYECSGNTITYYDENSNKRKLNVTEHFNVVLNGTAYNEYSSLEEALAGYIDESGVLVPFDTIYMIDSDDDGSYDVLNITACSSVVVDMAESSSRTIIDRISGKVLELDDPDCITDIIKPDGTKGEFDDISNDSVLSVAKAQGKLPLYTLYLSSNVITAAAEATKEDKIIINKKEYAADSELTDKVVLGKTVKYYINYLGKIVYIAPVTDNKYMIGILAGVSIGSGISPSVSIKVYNGSSFAVYNIADKINLNDNKTELKSLTDCKAFKEKIAINSLIGVRLNNDGVVKEMVWADGSKDCYFRKLATSRPDSFQYAQGYINAEVVLDKMTKIFSTPSGTENDETGYSTINATGFGDSIIHKNYACYSVGENQIPTADIMVIEDYGTQMVGEGSYLHIVLSTGKILDNDGNVRSAITMMSNGKEIDYVLSEDNLLEKYDINIGDIVAVSQNAAGEITQFATRLRIDRKRGDCAENVPTIIPGEIENNATSHNSAGRMTYGIISNSSDSYVSYMTRPRNQDMTYATEQSLYIVPSASRQPIILFNKEKETARIATRADMIPGREMLAFTSQGETRNMFIFE